MNQTKKKFKLIWLKGAFVHMSRQGITIGTIFFSVVAAIGLYVTPWAWAAIAVLAVLFAVALYVFYGVARDEETANHELFIANWISSGGDGEERANRRRVLDNEGMDAALSAAGMSAMSTVGFEHSVNIDGTPMVQGTGVDIHGNPFGVTPVETGKFHDDTGGFVSPSTSYHDPFDMNKL